MEERECLLVSKKICQIAKRPRRTKRFLIIIEYHGKGGPLKVEAVNTSPLTQYIRQAGQQLGYPVVDPNGETMIG